MAVQNFGARLRQLRKQAGMTQRELADRVNVDFSYLSKIESGAVPPPSAKVILQLARALKADRDELTILAGKIPADVAQILQNRETLARLRSDRARQMAKSSQQRGATVSIMKRLMSYNKGLSKIAVPIVLVLAIATSLWFAAPTSAFSVSVTDPSPTNLGSSTSFTATITIEDGEHLPIQNIKMEIYNVADTSKKATADNLPKTDGSSKLYSSATTGGGPISATVSGTHWEEGTYTGYADWKGTAYNWGSVGGYGYQAGGAAATLVYSVTWTSPSGWPTGAYLVKFTITAAGPTTFIETKSFSLSMAADGGGGAPLRSALMKAPLVLLMGSPS